MYTATFQARPVGPSAHMEDGKVSVLLRLGPRLLISLGADLLHFHSVFLLLEFHAGLLSKRGILRSLIPTVCRCIY